jgi:hypothetical protein
MHLRLDGRRHRPELNDGVLEALPVGGQVTAAVIYARTDSGQILVSENGVTQPVPSVPGAAVAMALLRGAPVYLADY